MASTLSFIIDDSSTDFTYSGGPQSWTGNLQAAWYRGNTTFPLDGRVGSFEVSFEGASHYSISFEQFQ